MNIIKHPIWIFILHPWLIVLTYVLYVPERVSHSAVWRPPPSVAAGPWPAAGRTVPRSWPTGGSPAGAAWGRPIADHSVTSTHSLVCRERYMYMYMYIVYIYVHRGKFGEVLTL